MLICLLQIIKCIITAFNSYLVHPSGGAFQRRQRWLKVRAFVALEAALDCYVKTLFCISQQAPCREKSGHWQGQWEKTFCCKNAESLKYWESYWNFIATISDILGIYQPQPSLLFYAASQNIQCEVCIAKEENSNFFARSFYESSLCALPSASERWTLTKWYHFQRGTFHGEKGMQLQVQSKIGNGKTWAAFEVWYILRCFGFR